MGRGRYGAATAGVRDHRSATREQGQKGKAGKSERARPRRPPRPRHGRQAVSASSSSQLGSLLPMARRKVHRSVVRSEEHTSELQSLMRISYAVFCLKKKK